MSCSSVITLNNRITFSNCMEQQTKFLSKSHTEDNIENQINYSECRPSQCICQSTPLSCNSNICNLHQSCPETTHQSSQQQSSPSSSLFMHPLRPEQRSLNCRITSMCLQQAKSRFQKTVEIGQMTNFGEKSNQEQQDNMIDLIEVPKIQSQNQMGRYCEQKQGSHNQQLNQESFPDLSSFNEINTENVIDILQCNCFNQLKFSRDYSNRKQFVAWKLKIKDILLSKYQLFQIPKIQASTPTDTKNKTKQKAKKQIKKTSLGLRELSIRKIHKIFKKVKNYSTDCQNQALKIISNLQQKNQVSTLQFRRNLLKTFKEINLNLKENESQIKQRKQIQYFYMKQSIGSSNYQILQEQKKSVQ